VRVGLIYDRFGDARAPAGAPPDWDAEYEPEETVSALEEALRALGHEPVRIGNVYALLRRMGEGRLDIDAAINIAESYGSRNREAHAPVLLELAGITCIGSDALALSLTLDKHLTKVVARASGLTTPDWIVVKKRSDVDCDAVAELLPVFVKPRYEGTAKGITPSSRCNTVEEALAEIERQTSLYGQDLMIERFVAGAEFTVAVVGHKPPRALPVLQRAIERQTGIGIHALERCEDPDDPFVYEIPGSLDADLEERLQSDSIRIFEALECRDFARTDFRVDGAGKPWFLEINPLPTFAPDGTFAIIAELAGRSYPEFLAEVLAGALARLDE